MFQKTFAHCASCPDVMMVYWRALRQESQRKTN